MTEDIDLIRVTGVEYVKDYTMRLEFSNGKVKLVNFLPLLKGKLFEPLKDLRNFVQFGLTHWALEWYNGADFAPDYLYKAGGSLQVSSSRTASRRRAILILWWISTKRWNR